MKKLILLIILKIEDGRLTLVDYHSNLINIINKHLISKLLLIIII